MKKQDKVNSTSNGEVIAPKAPEAKAPEAKAAEVAEVAEVMKAPEVAEVAEVMKALESLDEAVARLGYRALCLLTEQAASRANHKFGRLTRKDGAALSCALNLHPDQDWNRIVGCGLKVWKARLSDCKFAPFKVEGKASSDRLSKAVKLRRHDDAV